MKILVTAFALFLAAALLLVGTDAGRALFQQQWSFTKSVESDRSTYFRLKVKLAYKGEPQIFDIVVGCNVRRINYKDDSSTVETGLVPVVFGRRMADGKGLVVRSPNACRGETTASGKVQRNLLPIVIVYDNADRLDFGIAYLSPDAYENPKSVLKFEGATVEPARRSEWEQFRQEQKNIISRNTFLEGRGGSPDVAPSPFKFGHLCHAVARFRLEPELRAIAASGWPQSFPEFCRPDSRTRDAFNEVLQSARAVLRSDGEVAPTSWQRAALWETYADFGLPTRAGGGDGLPGERARETLTLYPMSYVMRPSSSGMQPRVKVEFRGGEGRGLAYCFSPIGPVVQPADNEFGRKHLNSEIDGREIQAPPNEFESGIIFERDEAVIVPVKVYLESVRGDV